MPIAVTAILLLPNVRFSNSCFAIMFSFQQLSIHVANFFAAEEMKHPPLDTLQLAAGLVHFLGASTAIYEGSAPYKPNIWGVKGLGTNVTPNY
jgi:hypothetical protein